MKTALGKIRRQKLNTTERAYFNSLLRVHARTLSSIRDLLVLHRYVEISESSLFPLVGISRNPFDLYPDQYAGSNSILYASAQIQLDALSLQLGKNCFSVSRSFDRQPSIFNRTGKERMLGELTLVELQALYSQCSEVSAFEKLISMSEHIMRFACSELIEGHLNDLFTLGCDIDRLRTFVQRGLVRISYDEACDILSERPASFSQAHLDRLFQLFAQAPLFITHLPARARPFNLKRCSAGEKTLSFDLYLPRAGYILSGGLHENDPDVLRENFFDQFHRDGAASRTKKAVQNLETYLENISTTPPGARGGVSLSLERFLSVVVPVQQRPVPAAMSLFGLGVPSASDEEPTAKS